MAGTIWETDNPNLLRRAIAARAAKAAKARLREMDADTYQEMVWPPYVPATAYDHCEPTGDVPRKTAKEIGREVAEKHRIPFSVLLSERRTKPVVMARHEAFWRCHRETSLSLPQIGRFLGGKDHTTVLWGIRQHEKRMETAGR
jgi:hypothetical protein